MKFINLNDNEIIDIVKPLAEHTEESWNQKNYNDFCHYLLGMDSDKKFTEEEFNRQIEENYDVLGKHEIADFVTIHRNPDNVIVLWTVNFENRVEPGLLMYSFAESEGKVLIQSCTYHG